MWGSKAANFVRQDVSLEKKVVKAVPRTIGPLLTFDLRVLPYLL
jgi:hypothetical protein